jgi:hypothetical protein
MKPKTDQVELFLDKKMFINWTDVKLPSVIVDYKYTDHEDVVIEYIAFEPDTLMKVHPMRIIDIMEQINAMVYERVAEDLSENFSFTLSRLVKAKEAI